MKYKMYPNQGGYLSLLTKGDSINQYYANDTIGILGNNYFPKNTDNSLKILMYMELLKSRNEISN